VERRVNAAGRIAEVEAGLPAGVVNLITNAPEDAPQVVEALVARLG